MLYRFALASCSGLICLALASAASGQTRPPETAYYTADHGSALTYLLKPQTGNKVRLVNYNGWARGTLTVVGNERQVVLDRPIRTDFAVSPDSCGLPYTVRRSLTQVVFRQIDGTDNAGNSAVVEIGQDKVLDGCDAGLTTPFGAPTDAGTPVAHLAMRKRPGQADLVVGSALAGPTALALDPAQVFSSRQSVTRFVAAGQVQFEDTGAIVPAATDANGWLVMDFGAYQNGFTRLAKDRTTLAETWLTASFEAGEPTVVREQLFVMPLSPAGFGTVRQASRSWESGLFVGSNTPFFFDLFTDLTGRRISRTIDPPAEVVTPITWSLSGSNLVTNRPRPGGAQGIRTWVPLGNKGVYRWVMENEVTLLADGSSQPLIEPRVNFYIDRGAAVPPAPASAGRPAGPGSSAAYTSTGLAARP